jgi:hypothetical protein
MLRNRDAHLSPVTPSRRPALASAVAVLILICALASPGARVAAKEVTSPRAAQVSQSLPLTHASAGAGIMGWIQDLVRHVFGPRAGATLDGGGCTDPNGGQGNGTGGTGGGPCG